MGDKKALISRHIILPSNVSGCERMPCNGVVLIQGQSIAAVRLVTPEVTVSSKQTAELMAEYRNWNPEDYSDWFIGPGLVDCSVTVNPQWESLEVLSKTALAGGVTTLVVQSSLYSPAVLQPSTLYCDVGKVGLVVSAEDCHKDSTWPELAWKTYLFSPSAQVEGSRNNFEEILEVCGDTPLLVDPSLPSARMLFLASPYRLSTLEERVHGEAIRDDGLVAAALPDEISPLSSDSSGDESAHLTPVKTSSNVEKAMGGHHDPKPIQELSLVLPSIAPQHLRERKRSRTLMEGVLLQVKDSQSDITMLSAMEQSAYGRAGPTLYGCNSASTSTSENSCPPLEAGELNIGASSMFQDRMQRFRPATLVTAKSKEVQPNKEADYQLHLANCPEQWELNGVGFVLGLLAYFPQARVHFASLASATAISAVLRSDQRHQVSCETPAYCLSFCMEEVIAGDTRFKAFPAIRNKTNLNLLWDLLKLEAIDLVTSAHSSIPPELKLPTPRSFRKALSGLNSLGATLPAIWSRLRGPTARSMEHYAVRLFKWMAQSPAKLLGLQDKGQIVAGAQADLVVWAPYESFVFHSQSVFSQLNPFEGQSLYGRVCKVYVRGQLAYDEGRFSSYGKPLTGPSSL